MTSRMFNFTVHVVFLVDYFLRAIMVHLGTVYNIEAFILNAFFFSGGKGVVRVPKKKVTK